MSHLFDISLAKPMNLNGAAAKNQGRISKGKIKQKLNIFIFILCQDMLNNMWNHLFKNYINQDFFMLSKLFFFREKLFLMYTTFIIVSWYIKLV